MQQSQKWSDCNPVPKTHIVQNKCRWQESCRKWAWHSHWHIFRPVCVFSPLYGAGMGSSETSQNWMQMRWIFPQASSMHGKLPPKNDESRGPVATGTQPDPLRSALWKKGICTRILEIPSSNSATADPLALYPWPTTLLVIWTSYLLHTWYAVIQRSFWFLMSLHVYK